MQERDLVVALERTGQRDTNRENAGAELHNDCDALPFLAVPVAAAVLENHIDRQLICLPEVNWVSRVRCRRIQARV